MTKRDRILATLARKPVDRPAVSFWRHVPDADHDARLLAEAMLRFHRRWDLDFVKVMSSGVYCVEDWGCRVAYAGSPNGAKQCTEHAVQSVSDWERVKPLDPGAGALGRELTALRLIVAGRHDDAPVLHTIFSPLTIAKKLAGERLVADLRTNADAVRPALEAITETTARYVTATLDAGADGLFYATQMASAEALTQAESERFALPYDRQVLEAARGRSVFTLLHLHGREIYFGELAKLPVHAINWHDRLTSPRLGDAKRAFKGAVVGGLNEWDTLLRRPEDYAVREAQDAMRQTDMLGLIIAPGCVLPLATPEPNLAAAVEAAKRSGR